MSKGESTRTRILERAMLLASRLGLDGLSLGVLAQSLEISKSGLYAHFRSKEALVVAVLELTRTRFCEHLVPYLEGRSEGLPELRAYGVAWLDWLASPALPAGCPILGASFELEDVEGAARDYVVEIHRSSRSNLERMIRAAIARGELAADTPIPQLVFELCGITLAFHQEYRLLRDVAARQRADTAVDALLARHGANRST